MSNYVELYKKYRPKTWRGLIGQTAVAENLRNSVIKNEIPTAFGFFGPRGTGKTSSAFLLAKALNCLEPNEGNPCNKCSVCKNIDNNNQLGVSYVSMANSGSVDDVRQIVQQARVAQPVKKQVWILDEVHNLSKQAFDALLIPIEDKGMPSLFIFCSTEVDKIPVTILSRIQQRKLSLVSSDDMTKFLNAVKKREELDLDDDQIQAAIRAGRGSVRDTLSALESIIQEGDSAPSSSRELLEALTTKSLEKILEVSARANSNGENHRDLAEQLFSDLRDLLLVSANVDSSLIGVLPIDDPVSAVKSLYGRAGITVVMTEIGNALKDISFGADRRLHFEVAMINSIEKLKKVRKAIEARAK